MDGHFILNSRVCLLILLCSFSFYNHTQAKTNSLKENLQILKNYTSKDTIKVNLLKDIALAYKSSDPLQAKMYIHEAADIAEQIHYKKGQIAAYNLIGVLYRENGDYDSSIYSHLKCLKISQEMDDMQNVVRSYENLGVVYQDLDDSAKAAHYLMNGLEISIKSKDTLAIGRAYINLGSLYMGYGQNATARNWYFRALEIIRHSNDKDNLAKIYNNIGASFYSEGNYRKALDYFFQNAKIKTELNDYTALANGYSNIGFTYININNDSALYYFNLALNLAQKLNNPSILIGIYGNMSDYYKKNHDFEKAFTAQGRYYELKDSIFSLEKTKAIADMQTKYETGKKEQEIKILTGDKRFSSLLRNFLLVALALILAISLVMFNRYRFERKVNKIIDAEKNRSDELLLNILPAETAEELKKYGKTTAKNYEEVSVLFADIKGFSAISRQMTAQNLVADLDQYFGAFDLITEKYGLEKIKTIGDAYLCAGGLPIPGKGTPEEVINAALEMQQYVYGMNPEKLTNGDPLFEVRIGIHTGPVVAGVVGIKKFAYDIWGDTVNTAARMEQYGEAGKVNISNETYQRVKDKFTCNFRGNIEVKNKGVFAMYFVEGVRGQESGDRNQESEKA